MTKKSVNNNNINKHKLKHFLVSSKIVKENW